MVKELSKRELIRDQRFTGLAHSHVIHGVEQILLRATENKDLGMVENAMKIFHEKVSPFYAGTGGDINGFWKEISSLFDYDFGNLEWKYLKEPLENGALHFMRKLYSAYEEKFYQNATDLDDTMVNLSEIIDSIDEMVLGKKYSVNN